MTSRLERQPVYEMTKRWFRHPVTSKPVEFDTSLTDEEKLRLIIDINAIPFQRDRLIFTSFMPVEMRVEKFNRASVHPDSRLEMSDREKELRRDILSEVGYISVKRKKTRGPLDVSRLNVALVDGDTLTKDLTLLPDVSRLAYIGQTDPRTGYLNRLEHTHDFGFSADKTLVRLAIQQPAMFIEAVQQMMTFYERDSESENGRFISLLPKVELPTALENEADPILSFIKDRIFKSYDDAQTFYTAVTYARWLLPYLTTYIYLHDSQMPGFTDISMKVKKKNPYEIGSDYDEDQYLAEIFPRMINDPQTGIPQLVNKRHLNPELLSAMVISLANGKDITINGLMCKAKMKYDERLYPDFPIKYGNAAYDHDQESGTKANGEELVEQLFPGGQKLVRRGIPDPIGSFDERARLLMFMELSGMTKEQLVYSCNQLGIDAQRIYIGVEEYSIWHNVELDKVNGYIIPVAVDPGDVKKAITMFNILQFCKYRKSNRAAYEAFIQTLFANLFYGDLHERNRLITMRDFRNRTDPEVSKHLHELAPLVPYVLQNWLSRSTILFEDELLSNVVHDDYLHNLLVLRDNVPFLIQPKPGTIVKDGHRRILPYQDVLNRILIDGVSVDRDDNDTLSLPMRLLSVASIEELMQYKVIFLDPEEVKIMRQLIAEVPETGPILERAIRYWTKPILIGDRYIHPKLTTESYINIPTRNNELFDATKAWLT